MSLLKNCFYQYLLPHALLESVNVKLMLRACSLTMDFTPVIEGIFTISMLKDVICACSNLREPQMYRCIFLLAFFGFLHISNCVPRSSSSFDLYSHLAQGDITISPLGYKLS